MDRGVRAAEKLPGSDCKNLAIHAGVMHKSGIRAQLPQPRSRSGGADIVRASQLQHTVERVDSHLHLGRATLLRMRAQLVPDHLLPAPDCRLGQRSPRVAGRRTAKAPDPKPAKAEVPPKGAKVQQPKAGQKPNALQQPLQPSPELAAVVGEGAMPRCEVFSKIWVYIKAHKLQSPDDGRVIVADDKLRKVFGKDQATMFEMNRMLAQHLT